jgi:cytochrome c2
MPATDKFRYNLKTMHVVFAVSCAAILLATVAMMWKDHKDDWRGYQRTGFRLAEAKATLELQQLKSGDYEAKQKRLQESLKAAEEAVKSQQGALDELQATRRDQAFAVNVLAADLKNANAKRDKASADHGMALGGGASEDVLADLMAKFVVFKKQRDELEAELQLAETALEATDGKIKAITVVQADAEAELKRLNADVTRVEKTVAQIAPSGPAKLKRWFMEQPIIDGFNSHMKVVQDWLPDLKVTLGMSKIARFDRCRTCHINADVVAAGNVPAFPHGEPSSDDVNDWVAEGKVPHPFSTHPSHELYATSSSPHPVSKFGCTICHDGQGSGTSFGNAEHTPDNPEQFERWHSEYGFHPNHFWELPMQPKRFIESGCIKCHHQVTELGVNPRFGESAPKVVRGYETMKKYGCFGCHEIHGFDGMTAIGPDLRLEPNYGSVASQMMSLLGDAKTAEANEARDLLAAVHSDPLGSGVARNELKAMLDTDREADNPVFPRGVSSLASAMKDVDGVEGKMRKVGPSFRRLKSKTTQGWVEYWTEDPTKFRPSTRMPRFYNLTNQQDEAGKKYERVELAGIAQYLFDKSVPLDSLQPVEGYTPDVDRGKRLFTERGCLACHNHKEFPESNADFGPELSRVHEKAKRDSDNPDFSTWLYTWVKDPERYHERTKMPNLYLDPYEENGVEVDPAADIAAWLLSAGGPGDFPTLELDDANLDFVVSELLSKAIRFEDVKKTLASKKYPLKAGVIKGDEVELATEDGAAVVDEVEWRRRKLNYVGRKTISKYGCYGCHDIAGFETARPIGAALQDWGRKDTSKLALEHIEEWLHHHGEADGSSTKERVEDAVAKEASGDFTDVDEQRKEMSTAYLYQSLSGHGRAGFIWQKLRQPRSYDYEKTETKGYDERLRMPKFPFDEDDIEAVATFVLGLVAEPPAEEYIYKPTREENDRIEGEKLLTKYNCTGCHLVEMPEVTFGITRDSIFEEASTLEQYASVSTAGPAKGYELLMKLKPPEPAFTGESYTVDEDGESVTYEKIRFKGQVRDLPDTEEDIEDQLYGFNNWGTLKLDESKYLLPKHNFTIPIQQFMDKHASIEPGRGGEYAEWLSLHMIQDGTGVDGSSARVGGGDRQRARQMSPPPLYLEGQKVQTPWLYEFLLEPTKLRYETVLRMPRFNMSKSEAQTLANYFAASDGVPYPYQEIRPRDPDYIAHRTAELTAGGMLSDGEDYLTNSWSVLTGEGAKAELCSKCHSVAGSVYKAGGPNDVRGPNLQHSARRLRPDWLHLWLHNPTWVTPYTGMPVNFKPGDAPMTTFNSNSQAQVTGVRDALLNYDRIMEAKTASAKKSAPVKTPVTTGVTNEAAE